MWPRFGHSPVAILSAWLRGRKLFVDWPQFEEKEVILSHLSRISIALACQCFKLSPGDEVLVPSYNCGSEIDPLLWCGIKTVLYRVDSKAMIDIEDIKKRVTSKTRAVYITHYFGWPQPLAELAKWCKEQGLLLIEDCALSLFSKGPDGPLGCTGDAAIHCFWKALPVPDGGALCLPKAKEEIIEICRSPSFGTILFKTRPFIRNWLTNSGMKYLVSLYKRLRNSSETSYPDQLPLAEMPSNFYFDEKIKDWNISRISKGLMSHTDPDRIVSIRRRNYTQLLEAVRDLPGIKPLYNDLPEGVCPLLFPVLVSNPDKWRTCLSERNVECYKWWTYYHPRLSWEGFPEAKKLKNSMLAFFVDQHMNEKQIRYMADSIKAVSNIMQRALQPYPWESKKP